MRVSNIPVGRRPHMIRKDSAPLGLPVTGKSLSLIGRLLPICKIVKPRKQNPRPILEGRLPNGKPPGERLLEVDQATRAHRHPQVMINPDVAQVTHPLLDARAEPGPVIAISQNRALQVALRTYWSTCAHNGRVHSSLWPLELIYTCRPRTVSNDRIVIGIGA